MFTFKPASLRTIEKAQYTVNAMYYYYYCYYYLELIVK